MNNAVEINDVALHFPKERGLFSGILSLLGWKKESFIRKKMGQYG